MRIVVPAVIGPVILADPDDDIVLATAVGVAGGSTRTRWHLRLRGETTSIGFVVSVSPAGCSLQAACQDGPSVSHALPRSSAARAGTALIVNRATIRGFALPSTCRVSRMTSPTSALSNSATTPTSLCSSAALRGGGVKVRQPNIPDGSRHGAASFLTPAPD